MPQVDFDPFSEVFFEDPYEVYRRLRDEAPVYKSERYGFYALSRFEDVARAHLDWETFTSTRGVDLSMLTSEAPVPPILILMDPPEHSRMRALVNRVFTPRAVAALEPMVREVVCSFLEPLEGADNFDAVVDFAGPFPVEVISRMLGVPEADRQQIRHWLDLGLHREPGRMEPTPEGMAAMIESAAYFFDLVGYKRSHPADDMLSRLCLAEVERPDGERTRLGDAEIAGFASLLGGAGAETVTKLVANAVVLFHRHRDQWEKVLQDPSLIPGAISEVLRYWPPSQYQGRFSTKPSVFHDVEIPAGVPVLLITGAATRDERVYEDPDRFDIEREQKLAISFGHGVHTCLGAALARLESRVALEELARRWPTYEVDEAGLRRVTMSNVAGFASVPVLAGGGG
jgi:cytochrome P450